METEDGQRFEDMDLDHLSDWLEDNDVPYEFCKILKENYIDGNEFIRLSKENVEKLIPPIGIANRIIRLLPSAEIRTSSNAGAQASKSSKKSDVIEIDQDSPSSSSTPPASVSSRSSLSEAGHIIPSNWSAATQKSIDEKKLNRSVRNDIVRTLITLVVSKHGPTPKKSEVEYVARQLILKYPFMRDDIGTGYASWYDKLLERLRNLRKRSNYKLSTADSAASAPKKSKQSTKQALLKRYPPRLHDDSIEDEDSVNRHKSAMTSEMAKKKPRDIVLLPLLRSTYSTRRDYITSDEREDVKEILEEYPALRLPAAIEQDISLMFSQDGETNVKEVFISTWGKYVTAILTFTEEKTWSWRKALCPSDTFSQESVALKCLVQLFGCSECYIFDEMTEEEEMSVVIKKDPARSSPRMIMKNGRDRKFYIVIEQEVLCEASSLSHCLFLFLSSYYVFHLQYPEKSKKVLMFFQDYILGQPDNYLIRRGNYLAIASDIKRCLE